MESAHDDSLVGNTAVINLHVIHLGGGDHVTCQHCNQVFKEPVVWAMWRYRFPNGPEMQLNSCINCLPEKLKTLEENMLHVYSIQRQQSYPMEG